MMRLTTVLKTLLFALLLATPAAAQSTVVVAPAAATFAHSDADFAITASYHFEFYTCTSVTTAGVCVGQAATPFQAGVDVPKSLVTGTAVARSVDMKAAPTSGVLSSVPLGVGLVATVKAVADTSVPGVGGTSAASNISNAFFAQARTPVAPGSLAVR
jgi:hypothetical protein